MAHIFISHAEEDSSIAAELARLLEEAGYVTWHYEQDSKVGQSYLEKVALAVTEAGAVVLIISRDAFRSHQVDREVTRAHEYRRPFVPLLHKLNHEEFREEKPAWSFVIGATVSLPIPRRGVSGIMPDIIGYLEKLGVGKVDDPRPPEPWWKRWRRKLTSRAAIVNAAAAACVLTALALLLWMFVPPSSQVKFDKPAALFEVNYDGAEEFVYSLQVEVKNYGPEEYRIEDIRARVETPEAPDAPAYRFDPHGFSCEDEKRGVVIHEYEVEPLGGTLKLKCTVNVKVKPDEGEAAQKKAALLRAGVAQSLTVSFIGQNEVVIEEMKFCYRPTGGHSFSTRYTNVC
jgi:hypothetical protein